MTHTVYIGLGSNLGQRENNIRRALQLLTSEGARLAAISSFLQTAPWGFHSPNAFINSAACMLTSLQPEAFLDLTQRVERTLGRTQKSAGGIYHDRIIDIDILFYDNITLNTPRLTIPHPLLHERYFVLRPLCDIAPRLVHPVTGLTVQAMLTALPAE